MPYSIETSEMLYSNESEEYQYVYTGVMFANYA